LCTGYILGRISVYEALLFVGQKPNNSAVRVMAPDESSNMSFLACPECSGFVRKMFF
jgi:hypothetical protein